MFHILQIVRYDGTIDSLVNLGLEYSQIAALITKAVEQGYIVSNEGVLGITELGEKKIRELQEKLYQISSTAWIIPEDESRIDKIDNFDIYIPNRENLGF